MADGPIRLRRLQRLHEENVRRRKENITKLRSYFLFTSAKKDRIELINEWENIESVIDPAFLKWLDVFKTRYGITGPKENITCYVDSLRVTLLKIIDLARYFLTKTKEEKLLMLELLSHCTTLYDTGIHLFASTKLEKVKNILFFTLRKLIAEEADETIKEALVDNLNAFEDQENKQILEFAAQDNIVSIDDCIKMFSIEGDAGTLELIKYIEDNLNP